MLKGFLLGHGMKRTVALQLKQIENEFTVWCSCGEKHCILAACLAKSSSPRGFVCPIHIYLALKLHNFE